MNKNGCKYVDAVLIGVFVFVICVLILYSIRFAEPRGHFEDLPFLVLCTTASMISGFLLACLGFHLRSYIDLESLGGPRGINMTWLPF